MDNINVLIIGSSDMNGEMDTYNLPKDINNMSFPCKKYNGKNIKKNEIFNSDSHRCTKCNYTKIEHKYGYPLFPVNKTKVQYGIDHETKEPSFKHTEYSDLWKNKTIIFQQIKDIYGDNININYNTITPAYKNKKSYIQIIDKINQIIAKKIKIKGSINLKQPYNYSILLNQLNTHPKYKNQKYDCIIIINAGFGLLYTPSNFKLMKNLLVKKTKKPVFIGNLYYADNSTNIDFEKVEYSGKCMFMSPIDNCNGILKYLNINKKELNNCIENYTKILLKYDNFIQFNNMLYRR